MLDFQLMLSRMLNSSFGWDNIFKWKVEIVTYVEVTSILNRRPPNGVPQFAATPIAHAAANSCCIIAGFCQLEVV